MRWSNLPVLSVTVVLAVSQTASALPAPPGEPLAGATSIPVEASPSEVAGPASHPGEQTLFLGRQETAADAASYNNGMYTPWSATAAGAATSAVSIPAVPVTDSSVYLQPTTEAVPTAVSISSAASVSAIPTTPPVANSAVTEASSTPDSLTSDTETSVSESLSSSTSPSVISTSTPSSTTASSLISSSSSSSRPSNALVAAQATQTAEAIEVGPSGPKMSMILPVALSLGILAVLLACLVLFVYRRRAAQRRRLNDRRYEGGNLEKGAFGYGAPSEDDDGDEKDPSHWQTFQRNSIPYDTVQDGTAGGLAGRGAGSAYLGQEEQDSTDRGWGWGAANQPKQTRRPLPHTPQQEHGATMAPSHTMSSLHDDLDAMIAQSRTGYDPYQARPKRENSISNVATAIYSSLSGRSKRFGSKASSRSNGSLKGNKQGQWTEHGAWQDNDDASIYEEEEKEPIRKSGKPPGTTEDGGSSRPLLYAAIDDTPRKGGYSTYTPPDTPTREATPGRRRTETDDSDVTVAGGSTLQYSYTDDTPQHVRRFALRDGPVPQLSPGSPRRTRSKTVSSEGGGYDSPSCYSPSAYGHSMASPAAQFPDALQPGRSPALGSRAVSPPLPTQQHQARASPNPLAQSNKSGTTYSLSGMAGLLYSDGAQKLNPAPNNSYTALPPRKPRKQSILSKVQPRNARSPLSNEATGSDSDSPNPHRAVSAVVRASRARGNSIDSRSSDGAHWDQHVRGQLRESHSSSSSVDDLLTNILGRARSPA